jgi:uncharacterized OsmC-like protein
MNTTTRERPARNGVDVPTLFAILDHPEVLVGEDRGPLPVEYLLVGLTSCLTAGIGNIASARGVDLYAVESTIEGDIDLNGILGLSDEVRNITSG